MKIRATATASTTISAADRAAHAPLDGRFSAAEALRLYESRDIHTLGEIANAVREKLHGRAAFYNINRHINYTNYCVLSCKFCSFFRAYPKGGPIDGSQSRRTGGGSESRPTSESRSTSDGRPTLESRSTSGSRPTEDGSFDFERGYELSVDDVVDRAKLAYAHGATEVHIVGGLHPRLPFDYYLDLCHGIRQACPHLHVKAFTAIEIIHFSRISRPRLSIAEVLTKLREAGLQSLPGGGAEIFDDRVHNETFKTKVGEAEWFEVHRAAHELGIFTNATMLYGHVETRAERITHLMKLREHQAESLKNRRAHFNCVIPLSFIPEGSQLSHLPGPTGLEDLKTLAISRIVCDNIPHIKAFWIMQSPKLAQVALNWGVDDIDGTVVYYDITKREGGGTTHQELTVEKLQRLIVEAGCTPIERDTLYRRVVRTPHAWRVEGEPWEVEYSAESAPDNTDAHSDRPALVSLNLPE
ncbi:MAG: CofH family radical SAM protein [Phycisphaerales bacterium]|nr:CofH family radical SAM protein [Phycisphaerales bacterium]